MLWLQAVYMHFLQIYVYNNTYGDGMVSGHLNSKLYFSATMTLDLELFEFSQVHTA